MTIPNDAERPAIFFEFVEDENTITLYDWRFEVESVVGDMEDGSSVYSSQIIYTKHIGGNNYLVHTAAGQTYRLDMEKRNAESIHTG
jgi:hypothetical protein